MMSPKQQQMLRSKLAWGEGLLSDQEIEALEKLGKNEFYSAKDAFTLLTWLSEFIDNRRFQNEESLKILHDDIVNELNRFGYLLPQKI